MTTENPGILPVEHNPLATMPHDARGGTSNPVLGMLLFLCSEEARHVTGQVILVDGGLTLT